MTESSLPRDQGKLPRFAAAGLLVILLLGALAVSWTIPFQEWDAYSIGIWSRLIADGDALSPRIDQIAHQRPLFPVIQGLFWGFLGHPSMRAGRMLSLSFSVLLVTVTFLLARRLEADRTTAWIAAFLAAASPLISQAVSAATSDIPSAALLWAGVLPMQSARKATGTRSLILWLCTGFLWGSSALGKVTALAICAGFIATTIVYGVRHRWPSKSWGAMTIGLALPGYVVFRYWDAVRAPYEWFHFLFGWGGAYYDDLARSSRLPAIARPTWFGILLTLVFLLGLLSSLSARLRNLTSLSLIGVGLWAVAARLASPTVLREYDSARFDGLIAGVPTIVVITAVALALTRSGRAPSLRRETEFLLVSALYFAAWILKLGYERRFLVAILPPIAICTARWLRAVGETAADKRSRILFAAMLLIYLAVAWEGARLMDRGYPVFSREMLAVNRLQGFTPEAKMGEVLGPNMRIVGEVQKMIAENPHLRVISPDTRLPFFFGVNIDAWYPTPSNIANYDLLIWVNNIGILQQYRMVYGIPEPFDALRKTARLSEIDKTAEYELYRVSRQ